MVRPASSRELPCILSVYRSAREFMCQNGNASQWAGGYPPEALLRRDIAAGQLYVLEEGGEIHGVFALIEGDDPTYAVIEDGSWLSDAPYASIHRVASDGKLKGVFARFLEFSRGRHRHLRIDTHADNHIMQRLILKNGFERRGIIHVEDGSPRVAFEYLPL